MAASFFQSGAARAANVRSLFRQIAARYDLINDLQSFRLHRRWKRLVVRLASPSPGDRALDVCCGTGDIASALARSGAEVTGLDFSPEMLAIAEQKGVGVPGLHYVSGDAQGLPFPDKSFEIVTIGYGLRNLSDWQLGLAEMVRVAKPGGKIIVLEFGRPDHLLWRSIYFGYLKFAVPLVGLVFCRNSAAYAYILESLHHYPGQRAVAERMIEFGLVDVKVINLLGGAMSINFGVNASLRSVPTEVV